MDIVNIDRNAIPQEEHEAAQYIERNLLALGMNAEEFRQTAGLYRFAHARKRAFPAQVNDMIGLVKIAGRNGAIVASSFFEMMQALNATKAPTLWSRADMAERAKAANSSLMASLKSMGSDSPPRTPVSWGKAGPSSRGIA